MHVGDQASRKAKLVRAHQRLCALESDRSIAARRQETGDGPADGLIIVDDREY
jgi:hypothetical protein